MKIVDYLDYACIPYESLNKPLTLQMLEDKAYELYRCRLEHNYIGKVEIKAPPSIIYPIVNEIFDKIGYTEFRSIPIPQGLRYQFMHFIPWNPPEPGMCTMILRCDIINYTAFTPDCHYVYLNCQPQQQLDYQI